MVGRRGTRLARVCVSVMIAIGATGAPLAAQEMSASEIMRRLQLQRSKAASSAEVAPAAPATRQAALVGDPAPPRPTVQPTLAEPDDQRIELEILFDSGSADLAPRAETQLSQLCIAMRDDLDSGARYQIIGHTDATGDGRENLILSQSRAESVVAWLVGPDCRLNPHRLTPVGLGETRLKLPDAPEAAANRRVEIQLRS